ncbi:hypothetical protein MF271_07460 [Deinococcus sp. KNUC1210]|nr:hypothetical protein [Deinococcus sp. KNUC1210]ULH16414.1 hypothetical protein MF271_07460 [Deinococcus sp. KNUC1210]
MFQYAQCRRHTDPERRRRRARQRLLDGTGQPNSAADEQDRDSQHHQRAGQQQASQCRCCALHTAQPIAQQHRQIAVVGAGQRLGKGAEFGKDPVIQPAFTPDQGQQMCVQPAAERTQSHLQKPHEHPPHPDPSR